MTAVLRQLLPEPAELTPEQATSGLRLGELAPEKRPYLAINMISTADGKITIEGRAGPIGNPTDQAILYGLRTQADAIMVGAGTARIERYGDLLPDPALKERRRAEGLDPEPLVVLVSASLRIPPDLPLLQEDARVVVLTTTEGTLPPTRAHVDYLWAEPIEGELALGPLLELLSRDFGVRSIVCEGGPTLNSALLRVGLADELWLALAPKIAGGSDALTAVAGTPLPEPTRLDPMRVLEEDSYLYLRYGVRR